jgi:hypothetical protein
MYSLTEPRALLARGVFAALTSGGCPAGRCRVGTNWPPSALFPPDSRPMTPRLIDRFCEWVPNAVVWEQILVTNRGGFMDSRDRRVAIPKPPPRHQAWCALDCRNARGNSVRCEPLSQESALRLARSRDYRTSWSWFDRLLCPLLQIGQLNAPTFIRRLPSFSAEVPFRPLVHSRSLPAASAPSPSSACRRSARWLPQVARSR